MKSASLRPAPRGQHTIGEAQVEAPQRLLRLLLRGQHDGLDVLLDIAKDRIQATNGLLEHTEPWTRTSRTRSSIVPMIEKFMTVTACF